MTVVYASPRVRRRSSTMSRTVRGPRFQTLSMTAVSSGPNSSPAAARRMRRRGAVTRRSSHLTRAAEPAPREHARVALADALVPVGEREVELDDVVAVPRDVGHAHRLLTAIDDAGERHGRELALGEGLRQARPDRRALRGVLAERQSVKEA